MYIAIPTHKLNAIKQIGERRQALKNQLEEAISTVEHIKSMISALPSSKQLALEQALPVGTVRQLLVGRNYSDRGTLPTKIRSTNQELARRQCLASSP
jgi:hypothetical protein